MDGHRSRHPAGPRAAPGVARTASRGGPLPPRRQLAASCGSSVYDAAGDVRPRQVGDGEHGARGDSCGPTGGVARWRGGAGPRPLHRAGATRSRPPSASLLVRKRRHPGIGEALVISARGGGGDPPRLRKGHMSTVIVTMAANRDRRRRSAASAESLRDFHGLGAPWVLVGTLCQSPRPQRQGFMVATRRNRAGRDAGWHERW